MQEYIRKNLAEFRKREGRGRDYNECEYIFRIATNQELWKEYYSYRAKDRMADAMPEYHATGPDGNQDFIITEGSFDEDGLVGWIIMTGIPLDWDEGETGYWVMQGVKDMIMRSFDSHTKRELGLEEEGAITLELEECVLSFKEAEKKGMRKEKREELWSELEKKRGKRE